MRQSGILPHVYYTVSELACIKDITQLKNSNVKTMGYINGERAFEIDLKNGSIENSDVSIQLDLRHADSMITGTKPYLIFGVLYIQNQSPALSVKTVKEFDGDFENLTIYHNQLLEIRKRCSYFEDMTEKSQKDT